MAGEQVPGDDGGGLRAPALSRRTLSAGAVAIAAGAAGLVYWRSRAGASPPPVHPPSPGIGGTGGTGAIMWPVKARITWVGDILLPVGPALYFGEDSGAVRAVDGRTGAPIWHFREAGSPVTITTDLVVGQGRVFACLSHGDSAATVVAFDAATGHPVWRHRVTGAVPSIHGDGDLLLYTTASALGALRASDGAPAWTLALRDPSSVEFAGPLAVVTHHRREGDGHGMTVLRLSDGHPVWETGFPGAAGVTTLPLGPEILVAVTRPESGEIGVHRLRDGKRMWTRRWPRYVTWAAASRAVLVTTDLDRLRGLDPATGATRWTLPRRTGGGPQTWIAGDLVVTSLITRRADGRFDLLGLDRRTGRVRWTSPLRLWLDSGVVGDGVLYATTTDDRGHVVAVDTESGAPLWTTKVPPGSRLTLGHGVLYTYSGYTEPGGDLIHALDLDTGRRIER